MPGDDAFPSVDDVYDVHDDVVARWDLSYQGTCAISPDRTLQSVLEGAASRDDPYERAAALLRKLANAHVFEDGNKRTAWITAKTYLRLRGYPTVPGGERAATVMRHFKRYDVDELAIWLKSGEIDESRLRTRG